MTATPNYTEVMPISRDQDNAVDVRFSLTGIRRKISSNPDRAYVSAMHWKELTTSSGPFSAKKLS
jgi:hypothetical protein